MLYRQGCQGNVRASELYLAYRWGKPVQYTVAAELSPEQKVAGMTEEAMHARCRTAWNGYRSKFQRQDSVKKRPKRITPEMLANLSSEENHELILLLQTLDMPT